MTKFFFNAAAFLFFLCVCPLFILCRVIPLKTQGCSLFQFTLPHLPFKVFFQYSACLVFFSSSLAVFNTNKKWLPEKFEKFKGRCRHQCSILKLIQTITNNRQPVILLGWVIVGTDSFIDTQLISLWVVSSFPFFSPFSLTRPTLRRRLYIPTIRNTCDDRWGDFWNGWDRTRWARASKTLAPNLNLIKRNRRTSCQALINKRPSCRFLWIGDQITLIHLSFSYLPTTILWTTDFRSCTRHEQLTLNALPEKNKR